MTDIEIARKVKPKDISEIAEKLGVGLKNIIPYGRNIAKITEKPGKQKGKLILVTAINPTKAGIGKTTVSIGLADAINRLGESVCLALREPSLGPVFGTKGGATGGGKSQIIPMEDINLHFTGDFHAITSANNLLCSFVDNHIFKGNEKNVDINNIFVRRCLDLNERALRDVTLNSAGGRTERFIITSASEVMAVLCMAENLEDLKVRLGNIMVALDTSGKPLFARDFGVVDAMAILLKDAIYPNLVQTLEGTPALVHMGPFANIAHGCNSVRATKLALSKADYVITEAGFGADLGAEKFLDFKCRVAKLKPDCVVLVATIKAIKLHGGLDNLLHHISVIKNVYKLPVVVTLNRYADDEVDEINYVKNNVSVEVIVNDVWGNGGKGAEDLAKKVIESCNQKSKLCFAYDLNNSVEEKIKSLVCSVYGGDEVLLSSLAKSKIELINKIGLSHLPIIMAKTQFSLSADKNLVGKPEHFNIEIQDIEIRTGAGFLVVVAGNMLLMPALGKNPAGKNMTIDKNGIIDGLF